VRSSKTPEPDSGTTSKSLLTLPSKSENVLKSFRAGVEHSIECLELSLIELLARGDNPEPP
jgi:hypothetical protein